MLKVIKTHKSEKNLNIMNMSTYNVRFRKKFTDGLSLQNK